MDWLLESLLHQLLSEQASLWKVLWMAGHVCYRPLGQLGQWAGLGTGSVTLARLEGHRFPDPGWEPDVHHSPTLPTVCVPSLLRHDVRAQLILTFSLSSLLLSADPYTQQTFMEHPLLAGTVLGKESVEDPKVTILMEPQVRGRNQQIR